MYYIESEECAKFDAFAKEIRSLKIITSPWFQTARRFFLYGGGKEAISEFVNKQSCNRNKVVKGFVYRGNGVRP